MRAPHPYRPPIGAGAPLIVLTVLLPVLLPAGVDAAPQDEERHVRREVVVVGSQPVHRHMMLERIANRGYLGVQVLELTPELRRHFGAPEENGVLVSRVVPEGPAAAAGIEVGDVISAVDGEPLRTTGQVAARIGRRDEGEEVELEIWRDRSRLSTRVTLAESERRQVEVGQFVWQGGEDGPFVVDLDPEKIERVIAVDPETINDSVKQLLQSLEAQGGFPGRLRLEGEQRRQLEKRIEELELRLREMERQLQRRHGSEED
jgi:membrane-associated protease RseP (regulator of RpoE activity)